MDINNPSYQKLKWLMFFRVIFTLMLLGSMIVLQLSQTASPTARPLMGFYWLVAGIFILSFCYTMMLKLRFFKKISFPLFVYIQISIDTFIVTVVIFMTGSFSSLFSFLYLVVIIYASMLIFRRGSMIMAVLCSIQYGVMVDLEFYGILRPIGIERNLIIVDYTMTHVLFKIIIMMTACFAVAFLSGLLSEQERKTKKALLVMEDHVKRVEKMAAVGEMAAGLAHEIKNPLASLRGAVQLLKEDVHDPDHNRLMCIVLREADRLSSLVSDFLLFAKPPVGRLETFELGQAISETVSVFERDDTCQNRIRITKEIMPGVYTEMDSVHLHQILWNLLLNAAESIEGEGTIQVIMYPLRTKYVLVKITDSGCGMSENTLRTIFDPFVTTKPNGTGLGLSIVHRIVETYHSSLKVESAAGSGTTFALKLRRRDPPSRSGAIPIC